MLAGPITGPDASEPHAMAKASSDAAVKNGGWRITLSAR
jgi:hypothetical protein